MAVRQLILDQPRRCQRCGTEVPSGAPVHWDDTLDQVWCAACPAAVFGFDRGRPGAAARREGARRSGVRDARVRARHPHIGGLILALSADPQSTQAWERGAVGEERVGAVLEKARSRGLEVLHDRRVPGSSANIDHIVVAPTGIWVIDTKRYQGQGVGTRRAGGLFDRRRALVVGGRDKTKLLVGVRRQVDVVAARIDGPWTGIPVFGAICFVDQRNRLAPSFVLDDVLVTQPKQLVASLISTKRRPLTIAPDRVVPLAAEIAGRFPVA